MLRPETLSKDRLVFLSLSGLYASLITCPKMIKKEDWDRVISLLVHKGDSGQWRRIA